MIRNLKVLIAAAMALAAFGALSATAHAAEELFHCSVNPCTLTLSPDEVAGTTTAHHVFVVKGKTKAGAEASVSFTCNQLAGQATVEKEPETAGTSKKATFTNLKYANSAGEKKCKIGAAETVEVDFTTCDYQFTSTGGSTDLGEVHVLCVNPGDGIDIKVNGTLCIKVTPFTAKGLGYHDVDPAGVKHEVLTATANVSIPPEAVMLENVENPNCAAVGLSSVLAATYTTGNTLVKAETDEPTPVPAKVWFT